MDRRLTQQLVAWRTSKGRKPLVLRGARQVGKTWLMKDFGQKNYDKVAYVNFESSKVMQQAFEQDFDINRLLMALQIETGIQIEPDNTLVILDEIQASKGALTALKYFQENANEYHIIAAGSLLGIAMHQGSSFPVGKVEFLDLYPLNFEEFLEAIDQKPLLDLLRSQDWELVKSFKSKFIHLLKTYYFVGGMPEVVLNYSIQQNFENVREIQKRILESYDQDFSKHAPLEVVPRIRMVWNAIPAQLSKENRKFIYGQVRQGARAKDFEMALNWLNDCGLVHAVKRVTKAAIPLKSYEDLSAIKLFLLDIGILGAMVDLDPKTILEGNRLFEEFKGAITEQFVLQQLIAAGLKPYYWSAENATAEIDLLIQQKGDILPIEVKAEENLKSKSLKVFVEKYKTEKNIRTSMSDFRTDVWLTNLPLYAISQIKSI